MDLDGFYKKRFPNGYSIFFNRENKSYRVYQNEEGIIVKNKTWLVGNKTRKPVYASWEGKK